MYPLPPAPRNFKDWRSVHQTLLAGSRDVTGNTSISYGIAGRPKYGIGSSSVMPFSLVAEYAAKEQLNEAQDAPEPFTLDELADIRSAVSRYNTTSETPYLFDRVTQHLGHLIRRNSLLLLLLAAATLAGCRTAQPEKHGHHHEHASPSRKAYS